MPLMLRLLPVVLALLLQLPQAPEGLTYVCPMHPDVHEAAEGTCPRCGMALVPLRPDTSAPFLLDVTRTPAARGAMAFDFVVRHPVSRVAATTLVQVHERPAHLFVVSADLERFEHLHPESRPDGHLGLTWTPPAPGRYHLFLDIVPAGALPQLLESVVLVPGRTPPPAEPPGLDATRDGVQALLEAGEVIAGEWARLTFRLTDAATGERLDGWEPWLGAWAHLFAVREGATDPQHGHPEEHDVTRDASQSTVALDVLFPRPGRYGVWLQIQRRGRVVTLPFRIEAK